MTKSIVILLNLSKLAVDNLVIPEYNLNIKDEVVGDHLVQDDFLEILKQQDMSIISMILKQLLQHI